MARRGKEQQLQQELETQEEWEDMLSKEGLCVVDVYQDWAGPVKPLLGGLRRLKIELSDDLLKFAVAKADTIDALEKYRGRCEPCFLFFAGGVLVAVVRGANAPLILRTITEQLAQEHKVLDGQAERKEIKDTVIAMLEQKEKMEADEEEREKEEEARRLRFHGEIIDFGEDLSPYAEAKKEVSVVIIKPDAVQSGKAEEIMGEMTSRGIEILRQEERLMTEDEVRTLYSHLQDEEYFEDIVKFMSSSPCIVLAITKGKTGENIIKEFRDLIGPPGVDEAKEQAPESLRAKYGSDTVQNAVHAADSHETAVRELAFFFPDFVAPTVEGKPKLQRTLALIRPDVYKEHKDEIVAKIRESGFKVAMQKEVHLNKEQAEDFYSEHKGQEYFDELTTRMSSGPLLALGLAREDAIEGWRQMLGPTVVEEAKEQAPESLRAQFAVEGAPINMLHGSSTEEQAKKEIEYFFPMEQTVAVIKPDAYQTKDEIVDKIHDAGFRIAARKETTLSREIAEEFYAEHKDKEYYGDLVEHMTSGPTYFMVLSREGAVDGWRSLIGETDPSKAREVDPDSIRGQFGTDTLKNAVHGSSNKDHAMSTIQKIFGELYFNKDGTAQAIQLPKRQLKSARKSARRKTHSVLEPHDRVDTSDSTSDRKTRSETDVDLFVSERPSSASAASVGGPVTGTPAFEIHSASDIDPDNVEAMLADQREISYEPAPEFKDDQGPRTDTPVFEIDAVPDIDPDDVEAMLEEQQEISYGPSPELKDNQERADIEKDEEKLDGEKRASPEPQQEATTEDSKQEEGREAESEEKQEASEGEPKTEQEEGEKQPEPEPEAEQTQQESEQQAQPEPEAGQQEQEEKAKSPEPQQETTEEKKEEQEPQQEATGEGEAQKQQEETKEAEQEKEETKEETKEEPVQQEEAQKEEPKEEPVKQEEETQEKQPEPEPTTEETSEEKTESTEQKTEETSETTEQKTEEKTETSEQKTEEQTSDEKKEETT